VLIRPVVPDDLPVLRDIERAAGRVFADWGMPEIAADEPLSIAELDTYRRGGHAWVAATEAAPVAYLVATPVDGNLHIEQVSVHPDHAHRGVGRRLIDTANSAGRPALTLTTFRDLPWNAPYYARLGFHVVGLDAHPPGLREIRRREADHGLDRWPRVTMRRDAGVNTVASGDTTR
jgi:GNAT superfamily N-acetyltransferase